MLKLITARHGCQPKLILKNLYIFEFIEINLQRIVRHKLKTSDSRYNLKVVTQLSYD